MAAHAEAGAFVAGFRRTAREKRLLEAVTNHVDAREMCGTKTLDPTSDTLLAAA